MELVATDWMADSQLELHKYKKTQDRTFSTCNFNVFNFSKAGQDFLYHTEKKVNQAVIGHNTRAVCLFKFGRRRGSICIKHYADIGDAAVMNANHPFRMTF